MNGETYNVIGPPKPYSLKTVNKGIKKKL